MRFFDLSQPLFDGCPNCHVHPPVRLPRTADHPQDGWRMEEFHMASHTGTHLDAPLHKIAGGAAIDMYPLETFGGEPVIVDLTHLEVAHPIGPADLEAAGACSGKILLLNTGWGHKRAKSEEWLHRSPWLSPAGAEWVVEKDVRAVGIDHFSIGGTGGENALTHEILLGNGVWVIEELCFREGWREFAEGANFLALPLLVPGFSGSPCRAVLMKP
jgi:kynurenine formamidase